MSSLSGTIDSSHTTPLKNTGDMAAAMTYAASRQSYYTIRFLADRDRVAEAYRAYAYFRWIDDRIDEGEESTTERAAFLRRQTALLEAAYRGRAPDDLCPEERMLAELIAGDTEPDSGLQTYLRNMMQVMAFDLERRGRLITAAELDNYIDLLATGVIEALLYFIGHDCPAPRDESRALAVRGACVIHMLRDLAEDCATGYINIPAEFLAANGIATGDLDHPAMRDWVAERVALARSCFHEGRDFIARVGNVRCRLAGRAYIARFEYVATLIERDGYRLRVAYPERKSGRAAVWMVGRVISRQ